MDRRVTIARITLPTIGLARKQFFKRTQREEVPSREQPSLMLESGGFLTLENGGQILLETPI